MKKRSREEIIEIVEEKGYDFIDEYSDKNYKRMVVFSDCFNYKYEIRLDHLIENHIPNFVDKNNPHSLHNISQWLINENKAYKLLDNNIYVNSKNKLNLYCSNCKDTFEITWDDIYSGCDCGKCGGRQIGKYNNLKYLRPDLAKEWNYEKNEIRPEEVTEHSNRKVWWVCRYGHEWYQTITNRSNGNNCPYCSGRFPTDKNRLSIKFPEIAAEWHSTLNGDLTPYDVGYASNKKVWWVCKEGHEWKSTIANRSNGRGCPECAHKQSESKMANQLKKYFKENYEAIPEYKIFRNPDTNFYLPYDFYIPCGENPEINGVYIEVHGEQHYKLNGWHLRAAELNETTPEDEFEYQKKKDRMKRKFARKNGTYVEIDLRKIKTTEQAIEYIEEILKTLSQ